MSGDLGTLIVWVGGIFEVFQPMGYIAIVIVKIRGVFVIVDGRNEQRDADGGQGGALLASGK